MDDLISRKALLEDMNSYKFDTVNDVARRTERIVKAHMFELVEKQPISFDLESIISHLKSAVYRIDDSATLSSRDVINEEDVIEILKSAANATNRKNGG